MSKRFTSFFTSAPTLDKMPPAERASPTETSRSRSPAPGKLRKAPAPSQTRSTSAQYLAPAGAPSLPTLQDLQLGAPSPLLPPPPIASGSYSRSSSIDRSVSRPDTPNNFSRPTTPSLQLQGHPLTPSSPTGSSGAEKEKQKRKHSWFGKAKIEDEPVGPAAWVAGHREKQAYDVEDLLNGRPVKELWDEAEGNCYVYLFPRDSGKGASFKVDSAVFASSSVLTKLAFGNVPSSLDATAGRQVPLDARAQALSLGEPNTPPATPPKQRNVTDTTSSTSSHDSRGRLSTFSDSSSKQEVHLYLPIKFGADAHAAPTPLTTTNKSAKTDRPPPDPAATDLQTLLDIRNFFAFLAGESLIATPSKHSFFQIFMSIAGILKTYNFANLDGSTFGEVASASFDNYVEELRIADVRGSREKTIEGVVLGERMRSIALYNEAFTHAVGKHEELVNLDSSKYGLISTTTQNRLVRAAMDLEKRTASVRLRLEDFEFPSLFNGIMNSKTSVERKEGVRFDAWKDGFAGMRKWMLATLQQRYGHWPPRARSKKNNLETSGLNRSVLRDVYRDLSALYDLLVDRAELTTRTVDGVDGEQGEREKAEVRALRAVLSEYDRSSPPVKPPVPFDLPRFPDLKTARPEFGSGDAKKDLKAAGKKLKEEELVTVLRASHNADADAEPSTQLSFIDAFREMERRAAKGCTIAEIADLRVGQWIFMYVVLQALPMLACDAPGIRHTQAVEYFLCEPPRSGVPWASAAGASGAVEPGRWHQSQTWYSVGEGGGVVSLPSDIVENGVEGIYRRSHCWVMAAKWTAADPTMREMLREKADVDARESAALGDGGVPPATTHRSSGPGTAPPPSDSSGPLSDSSGGGGLQPPPVTNPRQRTASPGRYSQHRLSSLGLGLEALPLPAGVTPDGRRASSPAPGPGGRAVSRGHAVDASKTFDAILADVQGQKKGKGRK
ncbi:hypothetical protein LTR08_008912 [Meristemomyces frigidus]|nr:hypothetical protein LTR08_008912 [Meristemomyces frigidus]